MTETKTYTVEARNANGVWVTDWIDAPNAVEAGRLFREEAPASWLPLQSAVTIRQALYGEWKHDVSRITYADTQPKPDGV